ncbi:hypothetical protein D3C84_229330 [compost metagenome]
MSIRLGDIAPDFEQDSSEGRFHFHDWLGNSWGVLFSHPANWQDGDDVVIVPSLKDEDEIRQRFPRGYKAARPYLRLTLQPNR